MTKQLKEMGMRLAALRDSEELTVEEMAKKLKMPLEEYIAHENGERDFSFSFLHEAAVFLGVDVLDIISGESPKLSTCSFVKSGHGYDVARRTAYDYKHLAFTFAHKKAEPFIVTVEPKNEKPVLHSHEGQEFNYILNGNMLLYLGDSVYEMNPGDSIYFNSSIPHAMEAVGGSVQFIAVVI
ncbi:MAG: XRE family transcriptional regulator [Clostridiales bacterium]|jgi:mannose-6-phosphate isomerase-like protein (cupin superfamily)|nr:XRE family transcriptional regulator [Clostridiales bacterium]